MKSRLLLTYLLLLVVSVSNAQTYIQQLADGSVKFSVSFSSQKTGVQAFIRKNGSQYTAPFITGNLQVNAGVYTYSITEPAATYKTNDKLNVRFYAYDPQVFIPGPTSDTWSADFIYGSTNPPGTELWKTYTDGIYYSGGNVQIQKGTNSIDLNASNNGDQNVEIKGNAANNMFRLVGNTNSLTGTAIEMYGVGHPTRPGELAFTSPSPSSNVTFKYFDGQQWRERMIITNDGNVGIKNQHPTDALSVFGDISLGYNYSIKARNTGRFGIYNNSSSANGAFIEMYGQDIPSDHITAGELTLGAGYNAPISFKTYNGGNSWTVRMLMTKSGDFGIGTDAPEAKLDVNGKIISRSDLTLSKKGIYPSIFRIEAGNNMGNNGRIEMFEDFDAKYGFYLEANHSKDKLFIGSRFGNTTDQNIFTVVNAANGIHVGIGTANPAATLSVKGKIEAEEIEVKSVGADYVFADSYTLTDLTALSEYIKANKHLPGIAPASVTEQGVELGAFSEKLLEKIEELTLYMIQLNEKNAQLEAELNKLKSK